MDEELLQELRSNAEEYSDVTDAIKADIPGINEDFLATYYDVAKRDDEVLRLMMEQRFGADKIARLDHYWNKLGPKPAETIEEPAKVDTRPAPDKPESFFGRAVSGTAATIADAPDIALAAGTAVTMRRAKFFETQMERIMDATLGKREVDVAVTGVTPEHQAWLAERGVQSEIGDTSLRMTITQRNRLTAEWLTDGRAKSQAELNEVLMYDKVVEEREAKLDTGASEMMYHMTDWATEFALIPGPAKLGKFGMIASATLRGAAADNIVFEEGDMSLVALAEELGMPEVELLDIIRTDDEKAAWQNRLAITIEGAGLGLAADSVFAIVGALRKVNRGGNAADAIEEANELIVRNLSEAKEARNFTDAEINAVQAALKEAPEVLAEEAPTSADVILGEAKRKLSKVTFDADKAFDTFRQLDVTQWTDEAIEDATGIRKFSEWTEWDNIADVRATISKHVDGVFEAANKRQSMPEMIAKANEIRKAQMASADNPDWASAVITKREDAVQYINNVIVERTLAKQLEEIRVWNAYGKDPEFLPSFLKHLGGPNVTNELREKAIAGYVEGLMSAAGVIGKKNETQISEAARVMASQRWIKYGKIKDAEQQLEAWIAKQKAEGNVEWQDIGFGLNRLTSHGEITPSKMREMLKHVGDGASVLVRFRNANLLANTKTIGINMISEAFGQTQAGSITRVWEGIKSLAKGKPADGIKRIQLGVTFGFRQFAEINKAMDNALRLFSDGIGEVSGAASAFDTAGKGIGQSFKEIGKENGALGALAQYTAGVNRFIGAISEAFSSMAVYTKTRDDAILGQFGKKWQQLAKKRPLSQEEITQMFVENDMPSLLLRRTKSGNLIDAGSAENAAIIGFRESGELAGLSDTMVREFRKLAHKNHITAALFDFMAPFAQTIIKITKRSLMNGVPAPLWFVSKSFRKRLSSANPAIRNLAEAEFALNSAVYTGLVARGFFESEDAEEARMERIAKLEPGQSIVAFDMIDEGVGFKEDKQGWVRITMMEDGTLKETHVLPQELNVVFSTAIAAQSVGRYLRMAYQNDPERQKSVADLFMMAAVGAPTASIRQNNLVNSFVESVERTGEMFKDIPSFQNWMVQNAANFVPLAPGTRHLGEDFTKMFGDAESMQYNSDLADDRAYKMVHNLGWLGAAYRQLTRMQDYEYLNVRRGPFGSPLPTAGRGLALVAKSNEIGQGEKLFAEFMEHYAGVDADRLSAAVIEDGLDLKEVRTAHNEHSLGDQMLENLRNVTISNMNIEEKMLFEFTNELSEFSQLQRELEAATDLSVKRDANNERTAKFLIKEQVRYLSGIRRQYLEASKAQIMSSLPKEKQLEIEDRIAQYGADYELVQIQSGRLRKMMGMDQ